MAVGQGASHRKGNEWLRLAGGVKPPDFPHRWPRGLAWVQPRPETPNERNFKCLWLELSANQNGLFFVFGFFLTADA